MKNDDIILLAIEHTINGLKFNEDGLLRFAKLVAQHEREACAEVCKNTLMCMRCLNKFQQQRQNLRGRLALITAMPSARGQA
jgi:hypothetical protein